MQTLGIRGSAIWDLKCEAQQGTSCPRLDAHDKLLLGSAMLSETSISSDEDISSASESARQDICADKPSTSSGSEHSEQFAERSLYCLALVNSETGDAVRAVTDEEAEEVARALAGVGNRSKAQGNATLASATPTSRQGSVARPKPGGPCNNCGVLGKSSRHLTFLPTPTPCCVTQKALQWEGSFSEGRTCLPHLNLCSHSYLVMKLLI